MSAEGDHATQAGVARVFNPHAQPRTQRVQDELQPFARSSGDHHVCGVDLYAAREAQVLGDGGSEFWFSGLIQAGTVRVEGVPPGLAPRGRSNCSGAARRRPQ